MHSCSPLVMREHPRLAQIRQRQAMAYKPD
jgi:hypothetical protein